LAAYGYLDDIEARVGFDPRREIAMRPFLLLAALLAGGIHQSSGVPINDLLNASTLISPACRAGKHVSACCVAKWMHTRY
jgi:hypothetical protein